MSKDAPPIGHTSFSWNAQVDAQHFLGHTAFSLGKSVATTTQFTRRNVSWKLPLTEEVFVETFYSEKRRLVAALQMKAQPRKERKGGGTEGKGGGKHNGRRHGLVRRDSDWGTAVEKSVRVNVTYRVDGRAALLVVRCRKSAADLIKLAMGKFKLKGKGFELREVGEKGAVVSEIDPGQMSVQEEVSLVLVREKGG